MKYYVYFHRRLDTNEVFYIGKGSKNRAFSTLSRNKYWTNIANKYGYVVEIHERNLSEQEAFNKEMGLIKSLNPTANLTSGGEGGDTFSKLPNLIKEEIRTAAKKRAYKPQSGVKKAAKLRRGQTKKTNNGLRKMAEKHSKSFSGSGNPMYGKSHWENKTKHEAEIIKRKISDTLKETHKNNPRTYPVVTCPHCNKTGGTPGLTRYHFDNCKHK